MPEQVTAAVLNAAPGKLDLETLQLDDPGPDEVLVDVYYAGLCRSDLHEIWPAACPTGLGHEASGVVRRVGHRVTSLHPGDHVVLGPGGTATILGLVPDTRPPSIRASELFALEKCLQGAFMGSNQFPTDIPRYVQFYEQGRLNLDDMLSATLPLDEINEGFERLKQGGLTRVVVDTRSYA